uniref:Ubiquitin carboxyl-terminal hydrolase 47 C-terminal domain-containing protein n=1 Tax=Amphimedon queenslandica TaxID=400682 RepID=A0A1X7SYU3_AMPQE
ESIELKQEISMAQVTEEESLFVESDIDSIKEVEEEPLYEELTVLRFQFNEIQKENKELSDKLSKMKIEYLRSLTSNTDSAASRLRRGMAFEIDDCKFHLKAMTRPDYQPLVDNKRIIEKLQERITLMNMELITEREHNEKIKKDIEDHFKETEEKRQRGEKKQKIGKEMFGIILFCNHPVTGELINSFLEVHKDELLPSVLDKAYELMELAPHISIERCRLVNYDYSSEVMHQSFDLDEFQHQTIGQIMSVAGYYGLFLETCKENETFKKYNDGGINLEVSVVDLSTGEVVPAVPVRGEEGWTVEELKQHIGEVLVDKTITLDQLKEALVPLIGVPPTGFRVCAIRNNKEYEMEGLYKTLMDIKSESELIVRLGRAILQEGEKRIKLYLLQVNNTEFCSFMMESIVAEGTSVGELKKQIIEEAKVLGIDCVLELDKMRLRNKIGVYPGTVYLDHQLINTYEYIMDMYMHMHMGMYVDLQDEDTYSREMHFYVEPLKEPEKKKHYEQRQVYVVRWRPSQCSVDPIEEIIVDNRYDPKHVIGKLSELSGVPAECIYYTAE